MRQLWRGAIFFIKHIPKFIIFGTHNLQTFKHNTLINKLLLMQLFLLNIRPKLHFWKWRKLRVNFTSSLLSVDVVVHPTFIRKLCYKLPSDVTFTFIQTFDLIFFFFTQWAMLTGSVRRNFQNFALFSGPGLKDEKLTKKQTYTKTETCKLYSRVFGIFLPDVIQIDPYNFEVYRFKVCTFFLRHSVVQLTDDMVIKCNVKIVSFKSG